MKSTVIACTIIGFVVTLFALAASLAFVLEPMSAIAHSSELEQSLSGTEQWKYLVRHAASSSPTAYNARRYEVGYYTVRIGNQTYRGQRDARVRLRNVPYDFTNKTVLDIGCNSGGMLFELAGRIRTGVGLDVNSKLLNAGTRLLAAQNVRNVFLYQFDVQKDPLHMLSLFATPDVCFLLSVCMWVSNCATLIEAAWKVCPSLIFETNGSPSQQLSQELHIRSTYDSCTLVDRRSRDDVGQGGRQLFLCSGRFGMTLRSETCKMASTPHFVVKDSCLTSKCSRCGGVNGVDFPGFCDWIWGDIVAYELAMAFERPSLVPKTTYGSVSLFRWNAVFSKCKSTLPYWTSLVEFQQHVGDVPVSVQERVQVRRFQPAELVMACRDNISTIVEIALFDTLLDNCDRFSFVCDGYRGGFADFVRAPLDRLSGRVNPNWFIGPEGQIVALDNAKSFRCHAFGNGLGAQRKQVEHFWRNWSHFGNQPIIAKLRALKREGRTLSSLLLARNPQLIPHRKMLAEMDHRARVVLHVVEATSTHSQLAELP